MGQYKLLAGLHYARDMNAEPTPILDANGNQAVDLKTKEPMWKYPSKKYEVGQIVESDMDLVERFGSQKFAYVGTPPDKAQRQAMQKDKGVQAPAKDTAFQVHPAGQVLEGHQGSTNNPETGLTISGKASERGMELIEEARAEEEDDKAEKTESKSKERGTFNARGQETNEKGQTVYQQQLEAQGKAQRSATTKPAAKGVQPKTPHATHHTPAHGKGTHKGGSKSDD